ncbi:hypothetical protein COB11_06085 [Candidatus Aerophobetes bacterium]|uniref:Uncharacterized protein n=1 Tax=Aerophobetes bacterium TaxID=2030807 RepID=A0A2A4YE81_UNCAE|nr:MAG: hypothetical protein COB11_06085 [Candidatus Aerophobetes bacterium]
MEDLHKKIVKELDDIISRAPDVDVEYEYVQFCEEHEGILWNSDDEMIPGIRRRMLLITDLMRFQMHFMLGADVAPILHHILNCAKHMDCETLVKSFQDEKRMAQMAKILEQKNVSVLCEQARKEKAG